MAAPGDVGAARRPPRLPDGLRDAFGGLGSVLVLPHDNPDPDALASAFALQAVLHHLLGEEVHVEVAYGGIIGRAENRAMLRELGLAPVPLEQLQVDEFAGIALVDTQPGFGNNSLPPDRQPVAVIDHHPPRGPLEGIPLVDVREGYGATSTILAEHVTACGLRLSRPLATALFYAIKSETQELAREASEADRKAYLRLFPYADRAALARIQRARVPREYFRAFQLAVEGARVHGRTVVTDLGRVESPDIVAEIADFLLRLEGADWACCTGRCGDELVVSLRTSDVDAHAGQVIRSVIAGRGSAGGHGMSAGGHVPLEGRDYGRVAEELRRRLLEALGSARHPGEPLVIA